MTWRTWLAFAALGVIWGLPYFFIKLALVDIAPAGVAWGRITLGALVLLPMAWRRGGWRALSAHKGAVLAFTFAELVGPFFLISVGERWISSSLAAILIATVPLTVMLLGPLFGLREPMSKRRVAGLVIGFAGVVVLLGIGSVHGWMAWAGVGCLLLGALGYSLGSIIIQRYLSDTDEISAVGISLGIASVVMFPAALWTAPSHMPSALSLFSLAVLGVVCSALALQLYFYLISRAGAARASVITYVNPAVAALLGVGVLHETFGLSSAFGLALILLGSWMSTLKPVSAAVAGSHCFD